MILLLFTFSPLLSSFHASTPAPALCPCLGKHLHSIERRGSLVVLYPVHSFIHSDLLLPADTSPRKELRQSYGSLETLYPFLLRFFFIYPFIIIILCHRRSVLLGAPSSAPSLG
ncbi:hypothetical protein DFH29DRAFT_506455 [Suillus ampliporus]|nr:hypothetical protein DFH29DRAFT_506455 [Suillus ampliporus]